MTTVYDVTTFVSPSSTSPYTDIGTVINEIMAEIHSTQSSQTTRPGAVIYIPPGHYDLLTRAVIDRSFIQIKGSGHGFMSNAIRDDEGQNTSGWFEIEPGGSHIRVKNTDGNSEAFIVQRSGAPTAVGRINGVEFRDFCLDGVTGSRPYLPGSGKIGISFASDSDSARIEGMGFVYLSRAIRLTGADASYVINNFIGECGMGIEYLGGAIVPRVQDNTIVCPWAGYSIYIENCQGALVTGNLMLWHGSVKLVNCSRSSVTANRFTSAWPGQIELDSNCSQILISGNHLHREGLYGLDSPGSHDDLFGMIHLRGNGHTVTANHLGFDIGSTAVNPSGAQPTFILVANGSDDVIANNHIMTTTAGKVVLDGSVVNLKLIYTTFGAGQLTAYSGASYAVVHLP
jgi:inulin fructotransferase (DFA-I-forming)